jgi:hypothetical protein
MRRPFLFALILATVTGCAQQYRITLTNNNVITTRSKPKLDPAQGVYRFKDAQGKPAVLPEFKIKEIEPL